jgi:methylmalonyl-CoA mutase, N-terminal domain
VLGGTQSLHTNSFDEALALPTEQAVRVALRTQQIIAEETGVAATADPLGGSYFVESLTDRLEAQAYDYFAKIDELGGMVEAVKRGFPQREIADAAFRYQQEIEAGQRRIVGVNAYTEGGDDETATLKIDPEFEPRQVARIREYRAARDADAVQGALERLESAARDDGENLMPHLLEAARAEATEGEMVQALQVVFGTYREAPAF